MEPAKITCLIASKATGGKISVFKEVVAPGSGPPLHTHENQLELFHVITGHIEFEVDGERIDVFPGGTATIPAGTPHAFINRSEEPSVIHFELLPSGSSEAFFENLVSGEYEDLNSLFETHGLRLLGPPIQ